MGALPTIGAVVAGVHDGRLWGEGPLDSRNTGALELAIFASFFWFGVFACWKWPHALGMRNYEDPIEYEDEERGIPVDVGSREALKKSSRRILIKSPKVKWSRAGQVKLAIALLVGLLLFELLGFIPEGTLAPIVYADALIPWLFGTSLTTILIAYFFAYRRTLYKEITLFSETRPHDRDDSVPVDRACIICYKHPVSKGYHLKKVHGMKRLNKQTVMATFYHCGCGICHEYVGSGGG